MIRSGKIAADSRLRSAAAAIVTALAVAGVATPGLASTRLATAGRAVPAVGAPVGASKSGATAKSAAAGKAGSAATDSSSGYTLKGDRDGTVFQSLTVQAEDRVHVDFDRPELTLDLEEDRAPGLEWGSARDVLDRTEPDLLSPLARMSSREMPVYLGRPWLGTFAFGPVARFHPEVEGVERWRLMVADSHGQIVATFSGRGRPAREIEWDGRTSAGALVTPGLTYSYVFEAFDRAGNKRNFVGPGFTVPAYRIDTANGPVLTFGGSSLAGNPAIAGPAPTPAILLECASWLDQSEPPFRPIRVTATARTAEQAQALADGVTRVLGQLVLGDPARLRGVALVQPDAPEDGTLTIMSEGGASR